MKKLLLISALALFGVISCNKEPLTGQIEPKPEQEAAKVSLNLKVQTIGSKDTKAVKNAWEEGDKLYLLFAQNGAITKEEAKEVVLTYNDEGQWVVTEGQSALDEISGNGVVSGTYLSGGDFEWIEEVDSWSLSPVVAGTQVTEAQMSVNASGQYKATNYTFSGSSISATITLKQVGAQISISNISGSDWTITADNAEYQEISGINGIAFSFGETIESAANTSNTLIGREENSKVIFYGIPTGETRQVQLTIANSNTSYSYSKTFPEAKTLQTGKAINVRGPQLNIDGSLSVANDWFWNENPVFRTIIYTTSDENKPTLPETAEEQVAMFGASVASHEYGKIIFDGIVTKIGDNAFKETYIQSIDIPNGVTSIGNNSFYECSSLVSVNLPEKLQSIGEGAFTWCIKLDGISIPNTVSYIGDIAFSQCWALSGTLAIPNGISTIGEGVFYSCCNITDISFPEGLQSIGHNAFNECLSLSSVTLPEGLQSIGANAFRFCDHLSSINLPASLQSIGEYVFSSCYQLQEACFNSTTPPEGLNEDTFSECGKLTSILIPYDCSVEKYKAVLGSLGELVQEYIPW